MARTKQIARTVEEGDSSQPSKPRRGIPPSVPNPDFPSQLAKWAKRKLISEKGINVSELDETPIPQTIENRDAHAARKEEIRAVKNEILREIPTSKGRTRAVISDIEDGLMQDFTELRTELKVSPYSRQKKTHPFAPSHTLPTGGPTILQEAAHIRIATERFLKELADKEAAARDPSGKGKGKLPGSS
ncbi:hypothetical protein LWI28_014613 [Acer negundo]|uniref:Uncharacterized protein n=1 Tax=Acer negundo TaxID=4023 RepID=A0AAD5JR54_ACENE|nr:hypothetical protein LWI28_014613 [Acer negundo]